jgi:hypothetical protein
MEGRIGHKKQKLVAIFWRTENGLLALASMPPDNGRHCGESCFFLRR